MMTVMPAVSLIDIASYLPENRVGAEYFAEYAGSDELADHVMFRSPRYRHHAAPDETAIDMAERAIVPIIDRHGDDVISNVDILLTHTQLPDFPVLGSGPEIARRMGLKPGWVIDVHNSGCGAFIHMMSLARMIMASTPATTALIIATQNCAGPVFTQSEIRTRAQAAVPGDGCGVGLLRRDETAPILDLECRTYPEFAGDMAFTTNSERKYWEPGRGQPSIQFNESKISSVFARGNRLVPEVSQVVCHRIGVKSCDIDVFITNQPNRLFLRNWNEALELPADRHPDSFDECGNLFAAGIPVTLDLENRAGRIRNGAVVLMSAFAHAGDFAAAAAVRWGAAP